MQTSSQRKQVSVNDTTRGRFLFPQSVHRQLSYASPYRCNAMLTFIWLKWTHQTCVVLTTES